MRALALVMVIAGCGFSGANSGSDADPKASDAAAADAPAIDAAADAPIDVPVGPADTDGDGIIDTQDNCPSIVNPAQDNEDGDAHGGDACDLCPHLAAAQTDADNDQIGADCDPRPGTPDQLLLFEGFNTPGAGVPSGWTNDGGGTWTVANGRLSHSGVTPDAGIASWPLPGGAGDHTVDASGTLTAAVLDGTTIFGVLTDASANRVYQCAVRQDNPQTELFNYNAQSNQWMPMQTQSTVVALAQTYRIIARAGADDQDCTAAGVSLDGNGATFNGTRIGLRVRQMTVSIPYVAVYRSP